MRELLFVFLGGGIGSVLRYGVKLVQTHLSLNPMSSSFSPMAEPAKEAARLKVAENAARMNKSFKVLVFTQGGPSDIAYRNCENTRKELDKAGVKYLYEENAQEGHSWGTWRADLYNLAQRIFK